MSIQYNLGGRAPQTTRAGQAALFDQAVRLHQQGQLAQANQIYNTLLQANPGNAGALHMLGLLAYQTGHHPAACDLIGQAIAVQPQDPAPYVNRALALSALQRHEEALAELDRAIALRPAFAEAHANRGKALVALARVQEAIQSYDQAIALQPRLAAVHNNKGNALRQLGLLGEAQRCYEQAIALDARQPDAWHNLATLHESAGRLDDAFQCLEHVLALQPGHAEAHNGAGAILAQRKQSELAIAHFQAAITADSSYALAYKNLGQAQFTLAQYPDAVQNLRMSTQLRPDDTEALMFLALALVELGQYAESITLYGEAIRQSPAMADLHRNRAALFTRLQRYGEALSGYLLTLELDPHAKYVPGQIADSRIKMCDWSHLPADLRRCEEGLAAGRPTVPPFTALALWDVPGLHRAAAEAYVADLYPESSALGPVAVQASGGKIRIGYYSADFHNHATAYLMAELFEAHDRERFEWYAFSFGPPADDAMRRRLGQAFDHFLDVRSRSDVDIARLSREMGIDIAVDLKGFTTDTRFGIFAHRCAPVQVSYLGYPGTTGARYMDYVIADKVVLPPEAQVHFTEKVVYLPHSYQVNDSRRKISDRIFTREELGLPAAGFVFCCFNNNYKIMPPVFDSWMRILQAVPESVLWLLEDNPAVPGNLRREAKARGVSEERLVFAARMPLDEHLARHRCADLFLDTLPYNAHTTASDALWAGLPVLTCQGTSFAGRVASSLLEAVGLHELVTRDQAGYEALAVSLARDSGRLRDLRERLVAQKLASPLFNARQFAREMEAAYLSMLEQPSSGNGPV